MVSDLTPEESDRVATDLRSRMRPARKWSGTAVTARSRHRTVGGSMQAENTEGAAALPARFWQRVHMTHTCWIWTGYRDRGGYGSISLNGRTRGAHRVSYEWYAGPVPEGLVVDHLCRIPSCVNPQHLQAVTQKENIARTDKAMRTRCTKGHPYDEANTRWYSKPGDDYVYRRCRACEAEAEAKRPPRDWSKRVRKKAAA